MLDGKDTAISSALILAIIHGVENIFSLLIWQQNT